MFRARNQRLLGELNGAGGRSAEPYRPTALFFSATAGAGAFGAPAAATRSLRRTV